MKLLRGMTDKEVAM